MAESFHHQGLVTRAVKAVRSALCGHDRLVCFADGSPLSDGFPPQIDGYRPDVYATTERIVVVGEAKPPWDVESSRSEHQLGAFLHFVEKEPCRHMVLAVHWSSSATAKSVLRSIAYDWPSVRGRVHILDGQYVLAFPAKQESYAPFN
jgi:hypothetical protein